MFKFFKNAAKAVGAEFIISKAAELVLGNSFSSQEKKIIKNKQTIIKNITKNNPVTEQHTKELAFAIKLIEKNYKTLTSLQEEENKLLHNSLKQLQGKFTRSLIFWVFIQSVAAWIFINEVLQYYCIMPRLPIY